MTHDCFQEIDKAKNVSRCTWVCPTCDKDVSLMYFLWYQAVYDSFNEDDSK
jgi:hypothetical protein